MKWKVVFEATRVGSGHPTRSSWLIMAPSKEQAAALAEEKKQGSGWRDWTLVRVMKAEKVHHSDRVLSVLDARGRRGAWERAQGELAKSSAAVFSSQKALAEAQRKVELACARLRLAEVRLSDAQQALDVAAAAFTDGDREHIKNSPQEAATLLSTRAWNTLHNSGIPLPSGGPAAVVAQLRGQPFDWERLLRTKNLGRLTYGEICAALDGVVETPAPPFTDQGRRKW